MSVPANAEDIVVVRAIRDRHGDVVSYTEHTLPGCVVAPSSSNEDVDGGDQVVSRVDVYVLADADVKAADRLRRPSDPPPDDVAPFKSRANWRVVGDTAPWRSPWTSWSPGVVVTIERVSG